MRCCEGCGGELLRRHQIRFCSNACQRTAQRRTNIERWLATGEAAVWSNSTHYVRQYLLQAQEGRCAICSRPNVWCGAPLVFVLDHIDGDAANNRRENLRLVCPNCDSQLPTFKARNKGRGRPWRRERYTEGKSY